MLNYIDCSTEQSETCNQVNHSLISAPCHVREGTPGAENSDVQGADGMVWNKLTKFLSNKLVIKGNENSGFSNFL